MSVNNVNVVVITGNLTHDPELRSAGGDTSVCEMRVAVNGRRKDASGDWVDKPNFFNVVCFGRQAENCAAYLKKGRPVAIEGRLDWREWEAKDGEGNVIIGRNDQPVMRQAVQIITNSVQFLGRKDGDGAGAPRADGAPAEEAPAADPGPAAAAGGQEEDDIPF